LIYGSPVPGYAAPQDTTVAAVRSVSVLISIVVDGHASGVLRAPTGEVPAAVHKDLQAVSDSLAPGVPPELLAGPTIAWIHLYGAVSFELFGQLNGVIEAREEYFDYQMRLLADTAGL
jgi:Tetracyclin repressor-like, C-terminal domain